MEKLLIRGGKPLSGEVEISGMKNSALPVLFGTLTVGGICEIGNLPDLSDISLSLEILRSLGAKVRMLDTDTVMIDTRPVTMKSPPLELVGKMRASTYLIGAMLARFSAAQVGYPGGCDFGLRPINQHIKGFEMLGATITYGENANIVATAEQGLHGAQIYMDVVSVGATINVMLAAVLAEGVTVIENAAREPHIVDTACFLNACGADISGAGTGTIRIRGVKELHGCRYELAPDMIEAGTYMVAAAATGGSVKVTKVIPKHMEAITAKLREIGAQVVAEDSAITVSATLPLRATSIKTNPYPGFPTDMHPQFSALLCLSSGMSAISEGVWGERFKYTAELIKMGADIKVVENTAYITGVPELAGAEVASTDLRAGASLVIAGLAASGTTTVSGLEYLDRGYANIVDKLRALGADIRRM